MAACVPFRPHTALQKVFVYKAARQYDRQRASAIQADLPRHPLLLVIPSADGSHPGREAASSDFMNSCAKKTNLIRQERHLDPSRRHRLYGSCHQLFDDRRHRRPGVFNLLRKQIRVFRIM